MNALAKLSGKLNLLSRDRHSFLQRMI